MEEAEDTIAEDKMDTKDILAVAVALGRKVASPGEDSVLEDFPKEFPGDFPQFPTFSRRLPQGLHFSLDFPN